MRWTTDFAALRHACNVIWQVYAFNDCVYVCGRWAVMIAACHVIVEGREIEDTTGLWGSNADEE